MLMVTDFVLIAVLLVIIAGVVFADRLIIANLIDRTGFFPNEGAEALWKGIEYKRRELGIPPFCFYPPRFCRGFLVRVRGCAFSVNSFTQNFRRGFRFYALKYLCKE